MQLELAEAATLIETAVLHVRRWCDNIADAARAGEELPFVKRAQMRMDLGYAMPLPRSGRPLAQCAGRFGLRRFQSDPAGLARSGNGEPPRLVAGEIPTKFTAARWSEFRAAVAHGLRQASTSKAAVIKLGRCLFPALFISCEFSSTLGIWNKFSRLGVALPGSC